MSKNYLLVFWRSNKKPWVIKIIFEDWFRNCFCPEVRRYCDKNEWKPRALLFLDNECGHPVGMEIKLSILVKIVFLPPHTTSFLQPIYQRVTLDNKFQKIFSLSLPQASPRSLFDADFKYVNEIFIRHHNFKV